MIVLKLHRVNGSGGKGEMFLFGLRLFGMTERAARGHTYIHKADGGCILVWESTEDIERDILRQREMLESLADINLT